MTTSHIATGEAQFAHFMNLGGTAAITGRAQRLDELMGRWRKQVLKRKGLLSTVSILPLAACGGGSDPLTLTIKNPTDDISARTDLSGFRLDLQNANTELTMTLEQHNAVSFINTAGTQTVVLTTAGTTSTKPGIENYEILEGTTLTISASTDGVNVTETGTPSAVSTIDVSGRTLTGNFIDFDADDILKVTQSANISGASGDGGGAGTPLGFETLDFADTDGVTLTMTRDQHERLSTLLNATHSQTFAITTAGTITARDGIENYLLSADGNTITVNTAEAGVNITGGSGADTVVVAGLTVTGTYTDVETISATAGANISGVNAGAATGAGTLNVNNSAGTFTMSAAQHQGLATVSNFTNTQTFAITTGGAITARVGIEEYTLSAEGNAITVNSAEAGVDVTGGAGADTIVVGGLTTVSGTYTGLTAIDTISATAGANITLVNGGAATGAGILDVNDSPGTFTMTLAQHQGLATVNNTDGVQTFAITTGGAITARDGIENYNLSVAGNTIAVNSDETGVNITGGEGADTVVVGGLKVNGAYALGGGTNTIVATNGANIAGVNGGNATTAQNLTLEGGITMTLAQHNAFSISAGAGNETGADVDSVTLTTAGTLTGQAGVEAYVLADAGGSTFTQVFGNTAVYAGTGNDKIITSSNDAARGALSIHLAEDAGIDTVKIVNSLTATFGSIPGFVEGVPTNITTVSGDRQANAVDIYNFQSGNGKDLIDISGLTSDGSGHVTAFAGKFNVLNQSLALFTTGGVVEISSDSFTLNLSDSGTSAGFNAVQGMLDQIGGIANDTNWLFVIYDGKGDDSHAMIYQVRAGNEGDGLDFGITGQRDDAIELIAILYEIGADTLSSNNFIV